MPSNALRRRIAKGLKAVRTTTALDLSGLGAKTIDAELAKLVKLATLNLATNRLETLDGIENLVGLRELWVSDNPLGRLPEALGKLTKLEVLVAQRAGLTDLPAGLAA